MNPVTPLGFFLPQVFLYLNKKFKEVFGLFEKDGGERSGVQSHFADHEISAEIGRLVQAGRSWNGETQIIKKDGEKIQTLSRVDVISDENGEIIANIRAHTDITQQKEAEDALKESEERSLFDGKCYRCNLDQGYGSETNMSVLQLNELEDTLRKKL